MVSKSAVHALAGVVVGAVILSGCGAQADKSGGEQAAAPLVLKGISTRNSGEAQPFIDQVAELSHGSITLELAAGWRGESITGESESIDEVRSGAADFAVVPVRAWRDAGVTSFDALIAPMAIDSYALQDAVLQDGMVDEMLAGVDSLGLTGIGILPGPMRRLGGITRDMLMTNDFQGADIAISPGGVADYSMRALGATPHAVQFNAAPIIGFDGLEAQLDVIGGYDDVTHTVATNVDLWPRPQVVVANTAKLAALSTEQRQLLNTAAKQAVPAITEVQKKGESAGLGEICFRGKLEMVTATDEQLAQLRQAFTPVTQWLSADEATGNFLRRIDDLRAAANIGPELVPSCATIVSAAAPSPPAQSAAQTPIDGRYEMVTTRDELLAFGEPEDNASESNYGTWERVFDGGRFTETQEAGSTHTTASGTYSVDDDKLTMTYDEGAGTGVGAKSHRRAGEVDKWTWSLYRDQLTLTWIDPSLKPGAYPSPVNVKPWTRLGDAQSAPNG